MALIVQKYGGTSVGSTERIKERLQVWKENAKDGKIGTLLLGGADIDALRVVAEAVF